MEIWKDIVGYEGKYQVSNMGRVKSYCIGNKSIIRKLTIRKDGYIDIGLWNKGKVKRYSVHRLVGEAFISNPENKPCINHIDGNKNNNRVENLEWNSYSENTLHKFRVLNRKNHFQYNNPSTGKFGSKSKSAKKVNQYNITGEFIKTWGSIIEANKSLGVNKNCIIRVCKGKRNQAGGYKWSYT